ncbi:hypothetical protein IQ07DRAFT_648778 [Pyrenochaeta sp. DS3sAY3a]|nr:hypothetical protein IQ07DRAFT_648778 [Pyrenochaeta sp. DS3sAY3a]
MSRKLVTTIWDDAIRYEFHKFWNLDRSKRAYSCQPLDDEHIGDDEHVEDYKHIDDDEHNDNEDVDDEIIRGPEYDESSGDDEIRETLPTSDSNVDVNTPFARMFQRLITNMQDDAKKYNYDEFTHLDRSNRAYSHQVWKCLRTVSTEVMLGILLPAIPQIVQETIMEKTWTKEKLLAFPKARNNRQQGAYCLIITGQLETVPEIGCEIYVGASKDVHGRIYSERNAHTVIASRYTVDELPNRFRGGRLYKTKCREGVHVHP